MLTATDMYRARVRTSPRSAPSDRLHGRLVVLALLVAGLLAGLVIAPASTAQATTNGFWSLTPPPIASGVVPEFVQLNLAPGSVVNTPVVVTNRTSGPLTIRAGEKLAPVASDRPNKGTIDSNEATTWGSVSNTVITAAAGTAQILTVRIRVPTNAKAGDYAAQLITFGAPVTVANNPLKTDRTLSLRFSIRVAGEVKPSLELSTLDVQGQELFFRVTNTGNTVLVPTVDINGVDAQGVPFLFGDGKVGELFPGESRAPEIPLGVIPVSLKVTVKSEAPEVSNDWPADPVGAAVLTPGAVPPPPPNPGSAQASIIVFALLGLSLFILIWWAVAVRRSRQRRYEEQRLLLEGARQSQVVGTPAVAAAGVGTAGAVDETSGAFPPPAGPPVATVDESALKLAAVASGALSLDAVIGGAAEPEQTPAPGTPFPPPNGTPVT